MRNEQTKTFERLIGFDSHPDSFTAALLRGQTPAQALAEKLFHKVPMDQLQSWAQKHTNPQDLIVLEASGNSFQVVRTLGAIQRQALVLESGHLGKLKEAHANNDRISAVRIAKAYLAGTARTVWIPDPKTQERRDCWHAYCKAVKRTTQVRNRLLSYLSDRGVRLKKGTPLARQPGAAERQIRQANQWPARQWHIIAGLLLDLGHAEQQRAHWRAVMAQEVLEDPELLSIMRVCGVRDVVAYALGAIVGDINRFATPGSLVNYIGLSPAFDDSGQEQWRGGVGGHGRKDLRTLLIEAAQSILRSQDPLARWGKRLMARKGSTKLAVAAVARKLAVAIWYLMMGRWTSLQEIDARLEVKVSKVITRLGAKRLEQSAKTRQQWRQEAFEKLKTGKAYYLNPNKEFPRTDQGPA